MRAPVAPVVLPMRSRREDAVRRAVSSEVAAADAVPEVSEVPTMADPAWRAGAVDDELMALYPDAACALEHDGPFQLLVATVLSAQTTDARVNTVTPELFKRYPDAAALGAAQHATVVGHLTCVSQSTDDLLRTLDAFADAGVRDILAIRGDMPGGPQQPWEQHPEGLGNATELVQLIKGHGDFCVGVAAFPNVHQPDNDPELDARIVVEKAAAGADYAITQLFFESHRYVELVNRVRDRGSQIPIIPGIAPLTVITQIERFASLADCPLPEDFVAALRAARNPAEVRSIGLSRAINLCRELLAAGAPGLQFFTQNRWKATSEVLEAIGWGDRVS